MTGIMFARVHARAVCAFARAFTYVKTMPSKALACLLAAVLSCALVPTSALAEGEGGAADASAEEPQEVSAEQVDEGSGVVPMLASGLVGSPSSFVSADVVLDGEPVVGSFTVDGLTFAVTEGASVELVGVSPGWQRVSGSQEGDGSPIAPMLASGADGLDAGGSAFAVPESIVYEGVDYAVTSIGAYAFYLSGVTAVELPATVDDVDERAFRSSDVATVSVAEGAGAYASFDGVLYNAAMTCLLLIPEGRSEGVRIPYTAEEVAAAAFSHASAVAAISVDADSPTYSSEDGLLYSADGTVLLRVPAGATDIIIRDGCTTIAAGAMEACASLGTITAPASVTSISPDVFTSVPTVSLPAVSVAADDPADASRAAAAEASGSMGTQLTAMVALSSTDDDLPEVDPASIEVSLPEGADGAAWEARGFSRVADAPFATYQTAALNATNSQNVENAVMRIVSGGATTSSSYSVLCQITFSGSIEWTGTTLTSPDSSISIHADTISQISFHNSDGFNRAGQIVERVTMPSGYWYQVRHLRTAPINISCRGGDLLASSTYVNDGTKNPSTFLDFNMVYSGTMVTYAEAIVHSFYLNDGTTNAIQMPSPKGSGLFLPQLDNPLWQPQREGYSFLGWFTQSSGGTQVGPWTSIPDSPSSYYAHWQANNYQIAFDSQGGSSVSSIQAVYDQNVTLPASQPQAGYAFRGWNTMADGSGLSYEAGVVLSKPNLASSGTVTLYAQWERVDYSLGFDVDSEPGDEDYPGIGKPDETVNVESGLTVIEDPKRPGYVFQGWTIPNAEGTEAIDQDLVYKDETDGKWYVDASKLPDYASDDGRVELTARWTSVISVDVPSAVTFYADVVTQGNESREGAASSAFGQNKVASQSEVDLRIVGLESTAVATEGSTLGADSILKKSNSATPSSSTQKLFSLYPTDKAFTADALQDPDAVSQAKPADAVDFALDDLLLEKSFAADSFTIPAGDTLNLGYRLNLAETGTELDYDTLATLDEGTSASIANISYCFAADYGPVFWTTDDDGSTLELAAIKADAEAIAAGDSATISRYTRWMNADHRFYVKWFDKGTTEADDPTAATVYDVRIIGLNHDDKSDGSGKAGITFQFANLPMATYRMNATRSSKGGWGASELRARMNPGVGSGVDGVDDNVIWNQMPISLHNALLPVEKNYWNGGSLSGAAIASSSDYMFLLSYYEITSASRSGRDTCLAGEGSTYDFFIGTNGSTSNVSNPRLVIRTLDGTAAQWIQRSPCTFGEDYPDGEFWIVNSKGGAHWNSMTADNANAVRIAPAFCL